MFAVIGLLVLTSGLYILVQNDTSVYQFLFRYQVEKIASNSDVVDVFIGDSSLGNAIDEDEYLGLTNRKCLNVALTARYGYAGSLNMLRKVHRLNPELKNVIMMHTIGMGTRPVAHDGFARTCTWSDYRSLADGTSVFKEWVGYVKSIPLTGSGKGNHLIENGYMRQPHPFDEAETKAAFLLSELNQDKMFYLKSIQAYCTDYALNLVYMHGPHYEKVVNASAEYMNGFNGMLAATGIALLDTVIEIPRSEIGDVAAHVAPAHKKDYTESFVGLLDGHLTD